MITWGFLVLGERRRSCSCLGGDEDREMSLSPACWGGELTGFGGTCNSLNGPNLELPSICKSKFWFKSEFLNKSLNEKFEALGAPSFGAHPTGPCLSSQFGGTAQMSAPTHPSLGAQTHWDLPLIPVWVPNSWVFGVSTLSPTYLPVSKSPKFFYLFFP